MDRAPSEKLAMRTGRIAKEILPTGLWLAVKRLCARHLFPGNLQFLASLYGSDKWGTHWYAQHYSQHFARYRRKPVVLLEIGIGGYADPHSGGASLRMWRDYFPRGRIYGLDIHDKRPHDSARIKTFMGDQSDERFLRDLVATIGRPDIIIDDGSHLNSHVIKSFEVLFPLLADDGIYAIEDLGCSYWPDFGGSSTNLNSPATSMGRLKQLVDGLNHQERVGDYHPTPFDETIISMHFYHNLALCVKGRNDEAGSR